MHDTWGRQAGIVLVPAIQTHEINRISADTQPEMIRGLKGDSTIKINGGFQPGVALYSHHDSHMNTDESCDCSYNQRTHNVFLSHKQHKSSY